MIKQHWLLKEADDMFPELEWELEYFNPRGKKGNGVISEITLIPNKMYIVIRLEYNVKEYDRKSIDFSHLHVHIDEKYLKRLLSVRLDNRSEIHITDQMTKGKNELETRDQVIDVVNEIKQSIFSTHKIINEMVDSIQKNELFK